MLRSKKPLRMTLPEPAAVEALAYQLYLERGAQPGHDVDDWLEAERRLTAEVAAEGVAARQRARRPAPADALTASRR